MKYNNIKMNLFMKIVEVILMIILIKVFVTTKIYFSFKKNTLNNTIKNNKSNFYMTNNKNNENKILSTEEALERAKKYLNICKRGLLIKNIRFRKAKKPKISVIIPVFNSEKTIKSTVRSIQNQDMIDIEIILVNDFANNETTIIIKELKKKDPRIQILNNKKNMGIFYSRCIGTLEAKGRYITSIDNDDIFCDNDVFDIIYKGTENNYFDIISFKSFKNYSLNKYKEFHKTVKKDKNNPVIYQPELGIYPAKRNHPLFQNNILIWGKLIKIEIYKTAINLLGKERYSTYLIWAEDTSIFFVISSVAQSYKFIDKFGLFHFFIRSSSGEALSKNGRMFGEIFLLEIIFDFSRKTYKKSAIYKLIEIKKLKFFTLSNKKIKNYFKTVIKKIMNCHYIKEKYKIKIRKLYKGSDLFK